MSPPIVTVCIIMHGRPLVASEITGCIIGFALATADTPLIVKSANRCLTGKQGNTSILGISLAMHAAHIAVIIAIAIFYSYTSQPGTICLRHAKDAAPARIFHMRTGIVTIIAGLAGKKRRPVPLVCLRCHICLFKALCDQQVCPTVEERRLCLSCLDQRFRLTVHRLLSQGSRQTVSAVIQRIIILQCRALVQCASSRTVIVQRIFGGNQLDCLTSRQRRIAVSRKLNLRTSKIPVASVRQRQHRATRSSGRHLKSPRLEVIDILCSNTIRCQ